MTIQAASRINYCCIFDHCKLYFYLYCDPQHPGCEILEARSPSAKRIPERLVHGRITDGSAGMSQEQNLEIVFEGVSNQDPVLEDRSHLLLDL